MERIDEVSGAIVDAAIKVHTTLGPGLLESAYEACLQHELLKRNLRCLRQVILPIFYDGVEIEAGYRLDLLVEDLVIVELKAMEKLHKIHEVQLLSCLKLSGKKLGLLLSFGEYRLVDGVHRVVNGL